MNTILRQQKHLKDIADRYKNIWKTYDMLFSDKGSSALGDWPNWCYCPMAAAAAIVSSSPNAIPSDIGQVAALASWRITQTIYTFEPNIAQDILHSKLDSKVPFEVLYHLPEWCVYVDTSNLDFVVLNTKALGFYAHLEYDVKDFRSELRFLIDTENGFLSIPVHFKPSLMESLDATIQETRKHIPASLIQGHEFQCLDLKQMYIEFIPKALSLLLYLCSCERDVEALDGKQRGDIINRPGQKKTKKGKHHFTPPTPLFFKAAFNLAKRLNYSPDSSTNHTGTIVRPHVRRAHWHTFKVGPRSDEQSSIVKWLPPIIVNSIASDIKPTIKTVKQ